MDLFEKSNDLSFEMKNRFIRSATHESMATIDGKPSDDLRKLYLKLAKGGVGAIITGLATVQPNGKIGDTMLMMDRDELIDSYRDLNSEIHDENCRTVIQLVHGGSQTLSALLGEQKVAPSAVMNKAYPDSKPRELTDADIEEIINNFVKAIHRSKIAGFDAVQLHGAHGYLLSSFLTKERNRRADKWGGSLENRFRIIREIFVRAKKELPDYPLFIKISAYDFQKNGLNLEETLQVVKWLEEVGCDAIEVSCGIAEDGPSTMRTPKKPVEAFMKYVPALSNLKPAPVKWCVKQVIKFGMKLYTPLHNYNFDAAAAIKRAVSIPVMVVGGIRRIEDMQFALDNNIADYISMSRPFILEPSLINHLKEKKQTASRCIDCGYCLPGIMSRPLQCYYGTQK